MNFSRTFPEILFLEMEKLNLLNINIQGFGLEE